MKDGKMRAGSKSEFSFVLTEAFCVCGLSLWFNRISLKQKQKCEELVTSTLSALPLKMQGEFYLFS